MIGNSRRCQAQRHDPAQARDLDRLSLRLVNAVCEAGNLARAAWREALVPAAVGSALGGPRQG